MEAGQGEQRVHEKGRLKGIANQPVLHNVFNRALVVSLDGEGGVCAGGVEPEQAHVNVVDRGRGAIERLDDDQGSGGAGVGQRQGRRLASGEAEDGRRRGR